MGDSGGHKADVTSLSPKDADSNGASTSKLRQIESSQTQRREANYLQVIARASSSLTAILTSHPYNMPVNLSEKLRTSHDVSRGLTTGGGVHFDSECVVFSCIHLISTV